MLKHYENNGLKSFHVGNYSTMNIAKYLLVFSLIFFFSLIFVFTEETIERKH